ncbi:MAG: DUF4239 domain-containing protein [Isosphaeraceae bacterium]
MSDLLEQIAHLTGMSDTAFCLACTFLSALLAWFVGRIAIRKFPFLDIVESGEGIGSYCNIIGVLYAVVLGYVLVNVYESYSMADTKVEDEASIVIDLLRDAEGLPALQGLLFRKATLEYVNSVIDDEWEYMIEKRTYHPATFDKFANLFHIARSVKCESEEQRIFLTAIVEKLNELSSTRRERVAVANSRLPDMLWGMIIGVGLVAFGICFIFPIENDRVRLILVSSTAAVMTFTTLLMFILDRPYNGSLGIKPESLETIRKIIKERSVMKLFEDQATGSDANNKPGLKDAIEDLIHKKIQNTPKTGESKDN